MKLLPLPLFALIALIAAPALAQPAAVPLPPPTQPAEEGGLSGSVSDENEWQNLGIAIPLL